MALPFFQSSKGAPATRKVFNKTVSEPPNRIQTPKSPQRLIASEERPRRNNAKIGFVLPVQAGTPQADLAGERAQGLAFLLEEEPELSHIHLLEQSDDDSLMTAPGLCIAEDVSALPSLEVKDIPTGLVDDLIDALGSSPCSSPSGTAFKARTRPEQSTPAGDVARPQVPVAMDGVLMEVGQLGGFVGVALADCQSGVVVGKHLTSDFDLDTAAAVNAEVVRVQRQVIAQLGLDDEIEDVLIALDGQYHLLRPSHKCPNLFFYLVLDRHNSNLALARMALEDAESALST